MALTDSCLLVPECPMCGLLSVRFKLWRGAYAEDKDGTYRRVYLKSGETRSIQCVCNECGHEWEEYVEGRGDVNEQENKGAQEGS